MPIIVVVIVYIYIILYLYIVIPSLASLIFVLEGCAKNMPIMSLIRGATTRRIHMGAIHRLGWWGINWREDMKIEYDKVQFLVTVTDKGLVDKETEHQTLKSAVEHAKKAMSSVHNKRASICVWIPRDNGQKNGCIMEDILWLDVNFAGDMRVTLDEAELR